MALFPTSPGPSKFTLRSMTSVRGDLTHSMKRQRRATDVQRFAALVRYDLLTRAQYNDIWGFLVQEQVRFRQFDFRLPSPYDSAEGAGGGPRWVPGKLGSALSFDGVDDDVDIGDVTILDGLSEFTAEIRFRLDDLDAQYTMFSKWNKAGVWRVFSIDQFGGNLRTLVGDAVDSNTILTTPITAGVWHHIALVKTATENQMFLNGNSVGSVANSATVVNNTEPLLISGKSDNGVISARMKGLLDDARIWNVARTQQQIQDNKDLELVGDETGLVGYWKLNDGSGLTAVDSTVNGNDGALEGGNPLVNGASQTGRTLITDGWTVSTAVLKVGDLFQLANHLKVYLVTADGTSDGSGNLTINFEPPLLQSPADNEIITINRISMQVSLLNPQELVTPERNKPFFEDVEFAFIEDV